MAGLALLVTISLLAGDAVGQTTNYWAPTSGAGGRIARSMALPQRSSG
jgi:hypothetical protein